jgi:GH43 family beta-xylosidase
MIKPANIRILFIVASVLFLIILSQCTTNGNDHNQSINKPSQHFTNPIKESGADPWMIFHDNDYYYTDTPGARLIYLIKSKKITNIGQINRTTVWNAPPEGSVGTKYNIWGPHLNFVEGNWYIYYAAQSVRDPTFRNQRMWVLRSVSGNPLGPYQDEGEVLDSNDNEWAIDGSILIREDGSLYFVWSGIPDLNTLHQHTYIARMVSPTRIDRSTITNISSPTETWETSVRPIQEGQRPLYVDKKGKTIIMFSANASWSDSYCLGSLTNTDGNFLNPSSWVKSDGAVFSSTESVFGPGGASYVTSPDGKEDWIIYHAAKSKGSGWDRNIRAQRFHWDVNGNPVFGEPVAAGVSLMIPSGE